MTTVALGDVVDFYSGGTPSKSKSELWEGDVPWFSAKDIKQSRLADSVDHISDAAFATTSLRKIPAGTVVLVVRGMILAHTLPVSIIDVDSAINQDLKALLPRQDIDAAYLAAMLRAQQAAILQLVSTAAHGTKKLESRILQSIRIPLPSLAEQRRIAGILDQADAIRAKRRQVLAHLGTLTQAVFHDMFGNCNAVVSFGEVISEGPTNGLYRPLSDYGSGAPILRIDGFDSGAIKAAPWKRVRISTAEGERYSLAAGDIVINRVNALSHLGKAALIERLDEPSVYESNMMRIRLDTARVAPRFALAWLQSPAVKRQILKRAKKAINQASVNQDDIRSLLMPVPPCEIQTMFTRRAEQINVARAVVQRALDADSELFASLQDRAFRGEL